MVLHIDIETYSPVDLKKSGLHKYASDAEFNIILFAYAFDDEPVRVIETICDSDTYEARRALLPKRVQDAFQDHSIVKKAFNAAFERVCIYFYFLYDTTIESWSCTMAQSAMSGYPLSLEHSAKALKLEAEKMAEGRSLIRYFCNKVVPTKVNNNRTRNLPQHAPEKWEKFAEYCAIDVEVEREISKALSWYQVTENEKRMYVIDQIINDRGVLIDADLARNAIQIDADYKEVLNSEASSLTDLNNPNSVAQLKAWISEETGEDVESLTKEAIKNLLKSMPSDEVTRVLKIRQEMAKTSVKKYQAMLEALCADGKVRGLLQYYGASRSGRWAGRLVQVQNLPQNHIKDLTLARALVKDNDPELLEMLFGNVPDTLSQLIRTAFIPKQGFTFAVADFSAIEARIIAWLAAEKWRMEVFATHGKIYEASASQMFKVPIESVTKGSDLRQKGKIAELALGYGGGPSALIAMGSAKMGIKDSELSNIVAAWRASNPAIVKLWKDINNAAIKAVTESKAIEKGITFQIANNCLLITLPSGRNLSYVNPKVIPGKFGSDALSYEGLNQQTKKWERTDTYGGKLVENIIQAIARDCLAHSMIKLTDADYGIVMHIHDEVVIEVPTGTADESLKQICKIMGESITWANGLRLKADGYITDYYKKD